MVKIVEKPVKAPKERVAYKIVDRNCVTGRFKELHTVNADSKTFVSDLGKAFRSNVKTVLQKKK